MFWRILASLAVIVLILLAVRPLMRRAFKDETMGGGAKTEEAK